jgi:hypothetical protein
MLGTIAPRPPPCCTRRLLRQLRPVNEALEQVEDDIRRCEREGDFGPAFVELARSVYRHNDRHWTLKRQIDALLGSRLVEEKEFSAGSTDGPGNRL